VPRLPVLVGKPGSGIPEEYLSTRSFSEPAVQGERELFPRMWGLRLRLGSAVRMAGDFLDQNTAICVATIVLLYVPFALVEAHANLLGSDELYTYRIARAGSLRQMLTLMRETDLHPPLSYLLERMSLWLGGVQALHGLGGRWLFARLPSVLAGLAASLALFAFVRRSLGNLFSLVGVAVFWFSPAIDTAWQNRPYMLWLALLSALMLSWSRAVKPGRTGWAITGVAASVAGMTMTHMFGLACVFPFLAVEAAKWWRVRRTDWPLWLALTLPCLLGVSYAYQVTHFGGTLFPAAYLPSVQAGFGMYTGMVTDLSVILGCCIVAAMILPTDMGTQRRVRSRNFAEGRDELMLLVGIALLPALLLTAAAVRQTQFFARYGMCGILAVSALAPWAMQRKLRGSRAIATLLVFSLFGNIAARIVTDSATFGGDGEGRHLTGVHPLALKDLDQHLPIVAASALTFTEMTDREPDRIAQRTYYLTGGGMAVRYGHATIFEGEARIHELMGMRGEVEPMGEFVDAHKQFYLIGTYTSDEEWLPRALVAQKQVDVRYLGKFASTYMAGDDVYLVTMATPPAGS